MTLLTKIVLGLTTMPAMLLIVLKWDQRAYRRERERKQAFARWAGRFKGYGMGRRFDD